MSTWRWFLLVCMVLSSTQADAQEPPPPAPLAKAWRKPADVILLDHPRELLVALQGTGGLSRVSLPAGSVREQPVGKSLTSLATIPGCDWILCTDQAAHRLISLKRSAEQLTPGPELIVPDSPVHVLVSPDGRWASVTSLWSRQLTLVRLQLHDGQLSMQEAARFPTGFAPRLQLQLTPDQVLVTDAFGGHLGRLDLSRSEWIPLGKIEGGNIRGLSLSHDGQSVMLAHSIQHAEFKTDARDIHWGFLTNNVLHKIPLAELLKPRLEREGTVRQFGQSGFGAADPAGLIPLPDNRWLATSSGTGHVTVLHEPAGVGNRIDVGQRPLVVVADPAAHRAYVVNQMSDSISVIDTEALKLTQTIELGPMPEPTPASRGERLFFSASLAHDNWLSCHSCHVDGHTTDGLVDTFGDGSFGTPKKVLSLLGTRDANPWAWDGRFRDLHEQVEQSITSSMQGDQPSAGQISDLVAYLHTLQPAPPLAPARTQADKDRIAAGRAIFHREGCAGCHVPPLTFTTDSMFDVGLRDEAGLSKFNPPSLRGVSQRSAFLHDGRADSLESVFRDHSHQWQADLPSEDLNALLEFLRSI